MITLIPHKIEKIISGGQTGADFGGLLGGKDANILVGGTAPSGFKTEIGSNFELIQFGCVEHTLTDYPPRTKLNVKNSDGTLIFALRRSPGCELTARLCRDSKKPHLIIGEINENTIKVIVDFINNNNIRILNVAGNRESVCKGIQETVRKIIKEVIQIVNN